MALSTRQIAPRKAFGRRVTQDQEVPARPRPAAIAQLEAAEEQPREQLHELEYSRTHAGPEMRAFEEAHADAPEDRVLQTGRVITKSFSLMGRSAATFTALIAACAVPERLIYHLGGESLSPPVTALGCFVLYACVFHGAMRGIKGEAAGFGDCLRAGFQGFKSAYATIALTVLSVWLLLTLPCIGLATSWAVAAPVALAEGCGFRASLARSVNLTAPYRPQVQRLVLLLAGLAVSRSLMMMPVWGVPPEGLASFLVGNWLLPLLLTAFAAVSGAVLYQELLSPPKTGLSGAV